jgi:hypothetical protein
MQEETVQVIIASLLTIWKKLKILTRNINEPATELSSFSFSEHPPSGISYDLEVLNGQEPPSRTPLWQVLLRVCLCYEWRFDSSSMWLRHLIPKLFSHPPCNYSDSFFGGWLHSICLTSCFSPIEKEGHAQPGRFMLRVLFRYHSSTTITHRSPYLSRTSVACCE